MILLVAEVADVGNVSGWIVPTIIVPMAGLLGFLIRWLVTTTTNKDEQLKTVIEVYNARMDTAADKAGKRLDEAIEKFTDSLVSSRKETRETVETITKHCQDEIRALVTTMRGAGQV